MERKRYLNMHTLEDARNIFFSHFSSIVTEEEELRSREAVGRVTSRPVYARFSSPAYHSAAMDGIAVRAKDTFSASDDSPVVLNITDGSAVFINTGQPMPEDMDAVVMIENVVLNREQTSCTIRTPVYPWQNVRKVGEDIVATELLFPSNHLLCPADIGALLVAGRPYIHVYKRPKVTIIPTGSELVNVEDISDEMPKGYAIIESNSAMLAAMATQAGAVVETLPIVPDDPASIREVLLKTLDSDADVVVLNAGSSAGTADYTVKIIDELGDVLVHGVTIMPGKPTILGEVKGKPVIGNPGYPVSSVISFEQFVVPLIAGMQRAPVSEQVFKPAVVARDIPSKAGIQEFRRIITGKINDKFVAIPVKKGAGAITTLTRANAMLRIPASSEGVSRGEEVEIELIRPLAQIERTILCTGSHDLALDILHDFLRRAKTPFYMASTHVGSLGGILAVRDGMTHVAGTHLLDTETGQYNVTWVTRYLKDKKARLFNLVFRQQGFMVKPGNPLNIKGIEDLTRDEITFVNRQAGSGTRVLFDYELEKAGISPDLIKGYENEEYTHMAVAVSVLIGKADAGLGILAAAKALGLDFIPVTEEQYDLLIPEECLELEMIKKLLDIIHTKEFRKEVLNMGGYRFN